MLIKLKINENKANIFFKQNNMFLLMLIYSKSMKFNLSFIKGILSVLHKKFTSKYSKYFLKYFQAKIFERTGDNRKICKYLLNI